MKTDKLENFSRAFTSHSGHCRYACECGRTYYDAVSSGGSWEPGELEELEANPKASGIDGMVGLVVFEGRYYVECCPCWHDRSERIMAFIDGHSRAIAEYQALEKQRKQREADESPVVRSCELKKGRDA